MTSNTNEIDTLGAMYAASQKRMRARLVGLGVPPTDVEDLRHEVFVVALTRRAAISNEAAAAAWLNQACEFVALAHRRKAHRRREVQKEVPESEAARVLTLASEPDAPERLPERLHRALAALDPLDRDLLALHLAADVPFRTLAELHGCDVKTVRKRFQSAAKRLRRIWEAETPREASAPLPARAPHDNEGAQLAPSEALSFRHLGANSNLAIGSIGNVLVTSWRGPLTPAALKLLFQGREDLTRRVGSPIASLSVIDAAWPVPHFDERQRIFQALAFLRQSCAAFCLFGAHSNLRLAEQIMRSLGFLLQMRYPLAASQDLSEAAGWLLAQGAVQLGAGAGVAQLVEAARSIERA
jgi:RNA polymerase sigma factor (sigma-70 family)